MQKRAVIVTGASGKVGIKILEVFLKKGFFVIAHINKNENVLQEFFNKNQNLRKNIFLLKANFNSQLPEIYEIMQKYKENLCGLVNCAAIFEKGNLKNIHNLLKIMQINDFTALSLSEKYVEIVKKGNIINILDGNIFRFNETYQNYRISKLFLMETTKQSALLFAPEIRINAIALGMLEEEITPSNSHALQKEILKTKISNENIAKTIDFLWNCENITGQTIFLDNGTHLL
ncbi:MAG: SDR family NAD(P)-dependent oxidoreductase [Chitinispirillales bacterium]|jgi:NAD(P)-dependent dehydrogenase (short-subunit alcohol dehydrogenase family)|nr:SDR family NAD(P)-dependent oxidoreductase [Chitinispirillales bacterium]